MCTFRPLYMFSDVYNSPSTGACLIKISKSLKENKGIIGGVSIAFGLYMLIILLLCGKVVYVKLKANLLLTDHEKDNDEHKVNN